MIIVGQVATQEEADELMLIRNISTVANRARLLAEKTKKE